MIEKVIRWSVYNRFVVIFFSLISVFVGLYFLIHLPIDAVPDITNNQVQINSYISGLSPTEIETQITVPIENALKGMIGLENTRSISKNEFSQITAIFTDNTDIYFARQQIQERLNEIKHYLPHDAEFFLGPIATGLGEIAMWTVDLKKTENNSTLWNAENHRIVPPILNDDLEKLTYLRTVQDWIIKPQLKNLPDVADIDTIGGYEKQIHITPSLDKLISHNISFQDILDSIANNHVNIGAGFIETKGENLIVLSNQKAQGIDEIGDILIRNQTFALPLKELATISLGKERRTGTATKDGHEVVIGTAMMRIGANSREVSNSVEKKLAEIKETLPQDVEVQLILNRANLVNATLETVFYNLLEGALLVVIVLFAMLGSFKIACIVACVIPLSFLLTGIGMHYFHISGNLMSLGAIDFGLIVDGSIIIAENFSRRIALRAKKEISQLVNHDRFEELIASANEMIKPTLYGQAILIIVYLPLLTLKGIEGKMFIPMAATASFALIGALVLSVTFVPAMLSLIAVTGKEKTSSFLLKIQNIYSNILQKIFPHSIFIITLASLIIVFATSLFFHLGQEFVPQLDEQDIALHAIRTPGTSLTQSTKMQTKVEAALLQIPEVSHVFSKTGTAEMATDPMPPNVSDTFVMLKPKTKWPNPLKLKDNLIKEMEHLLSEVPGNNYEFTQPIEMRFNELISGVKSDVAIKIFGHDFDTLDNLAHKIASLMRKIPGAADVKTSQIEGLPLIKAELLKDKVKQYSLDPLPILQVLKIAIGGQTAGQLIENDQPIDVIVNLPENLRDNPSQWSSIPIIQKGHVIPLSELIQNQKKIGVNEINRENGKRFAIVESNVRGNDLGSYIDTSQKAIKFHVNLPTGYWIEWGGEYENLVKARKHMLIVIPLCLILIFILLYSAFLSLKKVFIILTGIPFALLGGIIALWLRDIPFSISAAVGFIALSGIAVLNGLVMVNCIQQYLAKEVNLTLAVIHGSVERLRPVLMTALVASLGFTPMAFANGVGSEIQIPLATVVIGGIISSTLLTLVIVPLLCKEILQEKKTPSTIPSFF